MSNRIRIEQLDRTEEALSASESSNVMGGAPFIYYGATYPVYPTFPTYPVYPTYPVFGAPYTPAFSPAIYSPYYTGFPVYRPQVFVGGLWRSW